ncbi:MAG: PqqD family peptide modification chaperone [Candidatus Methanoperedens sp.]|nr:PqqD family peptide modification chaperone [Candidatus Methanoperedens sp.]
MNPFFFLKIKKGKDYHIFNPVDNTEYVVNYIAYRILEQCDGSHKIDEIADGMIRDFRDKAEAIEYITVFLDEMYRMGMIAWREEKMEYLKNCPPPSTVFWDITEECNLHCAHCYNSDGHTRENELSAEEIKRALEEMSIYGVENISFSGGEPFIRKDFLEIVRFAAGLGFKSVNVATNGTLIDRGIAERLKIANLNVQVSIDGDTAEIHDGMRDIEGAFDKAVGGIKLLLEKGVNISVNTTATKLNVDRIPNIIQLMQDLCVKNYRVQGMMAMGRGKMNLKELGLEPGRMKELVEYLENKEVSISSYNFTLRPPPADAVDFSGSGACSAANSICSINPEGNVVPCTYLWGMDGENLCDHTFQWIWENSALLNYFRSIRLNDVKGVCRDCKWLLLCHGGCKADNYANGDIFASNRSCWIADKMRLNIS